MGGSDLEWARAKARELLELARRHGVVCREDAEKLLTKYLARWYYTIENAAVAIVAVGDTETSIAGWTGEYTVLCGEVEEEVKSEENEWYGTVKYVALTPKTPLAIVRHYEGQVLVDEVRRVGTIYILRKEEG